MNNRINFLISILLFLIAFLIRLYVIQSSPDMNSHIDLEIYRGGGDLIVNGINPYDFSDNIYLRSRIRNVSSNDYLAAHQEDWDYLTSGNLPINLLLFGAISKISSNPVFYRYIFAFFDSILAVLIYFFVRFYWTYQTVIYNYKKLVSVVKTVIGLGLGVFSPPLIIWNTYYPEDKGIQMLLMIVAIMCVFSKNKKVWLICGSLLLGLSIAFKGLGVFLLPLYLIKIWHEKDNRLKYALIFLIITGISSSIWFIPYLPYVTSMMLSRLTGNIASTPGTQSAWGLIYALAPSLWNVARWSSIALFLSLLTFGISKKNFPPTIIIGTLLLSFVVLLLTGGSQDRMNIGILLSILLLGINSLYLGIIMAITHLLLQSLSFFIKTDFSEGYFSLIYVFEYTICIIFLLLRYKPAEET